MNEDNPLFGLSIDDITFNLRKLDYILKLEELKLEVCLIGGTACLLTGLISRATIDYDLLNLDYSPNMRNYLNFFNPYDLVDFEATTIPRSYKIRTKIIYEGEFLWGKILSLEDLILSKLCRNLEKDFKDIDILILHSNIDIIKLLISEVRNDINTRYPRLQENFKKSLKTFSLRYNLETDEGEI